MSKQLNIPLSWSLSSFLHNSCHPCISWLSYSLFFLEMTFSSLKYLSESIFWDTEIHHAFFFKQFLFLHSFSFIFGYAGSLLPCGLSSCCGKQGLPSSCGAQASHCSGFSCHGSQALEHRLNSCGAWASLLDIPRSGIESMSLALAGRFLPLDHQRSPTMLF